LGQEGGDWRAAPSTTVDGVDSKGAKESATDSLNAEIRDGLDSPVLEKLLQGDSSANKLHKDVRSSTHNEEAEHDLCIFARSN
jgi:hypothetical protein